MTKFNISNFPEIINEFCGNGTCIIACPTSDYKSPKHLCDEFGFNNPTTRKSSDGNYILIRNGRNFALAAKCPDLDMDLTDPKVRAMFRSIIRNANYDKEYDREYAIFSNHHFI